MPRLRFGWMLVLPIALVALGSVEDVEQSVAEALASVDDKRRIILSCGGGTPPGVSTENLDAFCRAAGRRA